MKKTVLHLASSWEIAEAYSIRTGCLLISHDSGFTKESETLHIATPDRARKLFGQSEIFRFDEIVVIDTVDIEINEIMRLLKPEGVIVSPVWPKWNIAYVSRMTAVEDIITDVTDQLLTEFTASQIREALLNAENQLSKVDKKV